MKKHRTTQVRLISFLTFSFSLLLLFACLNSSAQTTSPITSSGLSTRVSPPVTLPSGKVQYDITGGTRPGGGANLFHSFGDFNVPTNNIANFLNTSVNGVLPFTSNILARVTGTNGNNPTLSSIYGTIQTTGFGNANLFLMNPAGFLFGPNATVNVGGLVSFTSADYLRLTDNARFNAVPGPADALLTAAPVAAFGFIGSNPAAINFEGGQLTVSEGTGLSLVGGDINLLPDSSGAPSGISIPGRAIQMTSVAGPGEVAVETGMPVAGMALGTITLGEGAVLSTLGDPLFGDGSGGTVSIRGGQFVANGANILTGVASTGTGPGGEALTGGGGAVVITASDLMLEDSGILTAVIGNSSAVTTATGAGGGVTLNGSDSVTLTRSFINTRALFSNGDGGAVTVTSPIVTLEDSNVLTGVLGNGSTPVTANGGSVTLGGTGTISVSMTRGIITTESFDTQGNSGSVTITGQDVTIRGNEGQQTIVTSTHNTLGDPNAGNGGEMVITGNNVTFTDLAWVESVADSFGSFSQGGNIGVNAAQTLLIDNGTVFTTTTVSEGNAGNIGLTGHHVTIRGLSNIGSATFAGGGGGTLTITGTENIALESGSIVTTNADPGSQGPAGKTVLTTPHLLIAGGSVVASQNFGDGPGGTVTVQGTSGPAQSVLISDVGSGIFTDTTSFNLDGTILGGGSGGSISVYANSVTLQNRAILSAGTTGIGNAGNILVKADSINIQSGAQMTSSSSIRQTPVFDGEVISPPTGNSGTVIIEGLASPAQSVLIDGFGSGVLTDTQGTGAGGNISVDANSVTLQNGGTLSAATSGTEPSATGGTIIVNAPNSVAMTNRASITASSIGPGNTGNIQITAGNQLAMTNSTVTTEANQSGGGAIKITTNPNGTVQLTDSTISASVLDGTGGGGSVNIDPQSVVLINSQILANAVFGQGGNINITTNLLLPDSTSLISASSQFGQQGTIIIQSPISPASGKIVPLGQKPLLATTLLSQRCAALAGGNASSFTVAGRDTLPVEPGGWLSSPLALTTAELAGSIVTEPNTSSSLSEPAQEMPIFSLRRIAPPGFLIQSFAADATTGCTS